MYHLFIFKHRGSKAKIKPRLSVLKSSIDDVLREKKNYKHEKFDLFYVFLTAFVSMVPGFFDNIG